MKPEPLILRSNLSPGDIVVMTSAVRDLHRAHPGRFATDARTSAAAVWEHNPWITPLADGAPVIEMRYPLIHSSNSVPRHFLSGYTEYLEHKLGLRIPVTEFRGDIYLSERERTEPPHPEIEPGLRYWLLIAGGKYDFTAKWWDPAAYQEVVDRLAGVVSFVRCGESHHWHPPLRGARDLVGRTTLRQLIRLMYWAEGVVCPVTMAMHMAAAVPTPPGRPPRRPAVVIAGGREPTHWEAYPHHRYLSTVGALPCCVEGGCWRARCQAIGDGDVKDRDRCVEPVTVARGLTIPRCMAMIRPDDVARAVLSYGGVGALSQPGSHRGHGLRRVRSKRNRRGSRHPSDGRQRVLITFPHGLGDTVQLSIVLAHLKAERPAWEVHVATPVGRGSAVAGQCAAVWPIASVDAAAFRTHFDRVFDLSWRDCRVPQTDCPTTKPAECLREVFRIQPRAALFRYQVRVSDAARRLADDYLRRVCGTTREQGGRYPAVPLHYLGRTSRPSKELAESLVRPLCDRILARGFVPIVLDWDARQRLADQRRVFCPGIDDPLWQGLGTGDATTLAALIERSALFVGIDSGPLHIAGSTTTPALGVWTRHHPIHHHDLADNVEHLLPMHHERLARGAAALAYFETNYRHGVYRRLELELPDRVEAMLGGGGDRAF